MPIDPVIRSRGIGASEIAAIAGLDPRRDAFSVWAEKLGKVEAIVPTPRMLGGKRFEIPIAEWYGDSTGQAIQWFDRTLAHPTRTWQVFTPDAWVLRDSNAKPIKVWEDIHLSAVGGVDSKTTSWDQMHKWGESGTDEVPEWVSLQCQWSCSAADLPWWDVALMAGTDELRIYRIVRDAEIEATLLSLGKSFWYDNVLSSSPPPPGPSEATKRALLAMFPCSERDVLVATKEQSQAIEHLRYAKIAAKLADRVLAEAENRVKLAIGDHEGISDGTSTITWKLCKDTEGVAWQELAEELLVGNPAAEQVKRRHWKTLRSGTRKFLVPRTWE